MKFIVPVLLCATIAGHAMAGEERELESLRNSVAINYFEAAPHVALAKHYANTGKSLLAFYICEDARRNLIPREEFDKAFFQLFPRRRSEAELPENVDSEKELNDFLDQNQDTPAAFLIRVTPLLRERPEEAKRQLEAGVEKWPHVGELYFQLGVLAQDRNDLERAEALFVKSARVAVDSVHVQAWVGRFFLKLRENDEKALDYYLAAYFLDPHAYETEYVEQRIRNISWRISGNVVEQSGVGAMELLQHDNPAVVARVVDMQGESLDLEAIIELMRHDDRSIRWRAMMMLKDKEGKVSESKIKDLLGDDDFRVRGLAAHLWVKRKGDGGFKDLEPFLGSEVQLLQYHAVAAVLEEGGESGKSYLERMPKEMFHARVQELIENFDDQNMSN